MKRLFTVLLLLLSLLLICLASCEHTEAKEPNDPSVNTGEGHIHQYVTSTVPPSCTDGYVLYVCSACGHSYTDDYVPALGHRFVSSFEETTCDRHRFYVHVCTVCAYRYTTESDVMGTMHSPVKTETVPPTREEGGYTLFACQNCSYVEKRDQTAPTGFSTGLAYVQRSNGIYVSGIGTCRDTELVIPSVNEHGDAVVGIDAYAFENQAQITSMQIPDTIRTVGREAFSGCLGLTSITLPKNTTVGASVFLGCANLGELTMPLREPLAWYFRSNTAVPSSLKTLHAVGEVSAHTTLSGARGLTTVTLSDEIRSIPPCFFAGCASLSDVSFSEHLESIGVNAFYGTAIREISLPVGITAIPDSAFSHCGTLEKVTFLGPLRSIGASAFSECRSLTSIELPNTLGSIGSSAFMNAGLTAVRIPESVTELSQAIFSGCEKLTAVELHDKITAIEYAAFRGTAITSFTYPKQITTAINAFQNCTKLTSVTLHGRVVSIGGFEGCTALESIALPSSLKTVEPRAFVGCTALGELTLPESVTQICASAFRDCSTLTSVDFGGARVTVDDLAFAGCDLLSEIKNADGVRVTYPTAFPTRLRHCTALGLDSISAPLAHQERTPQ